MLFQAWFLVPAWFQVGSSLVPAWFQAGVSLVPAWFQASNLVPALLLLGSSLAQAWFLVPAWFQLGSNLVPVWFQLGSRLVPASFQLNLNSFQLLKIEFQLDSISCHLISSWVPAW